MNRIAGKNLILLSVFSWIIIAVVLPMFTSFGIIENSLDRTNYLTFSVTILAVFGLAIGLGDFQTIGWINWIRKFLAAVLIIPAGAFFVSNIVIRSFDLASPNEPFSYIAATMFFFSLVFGLVIVKKIRQSQGRN